MAEHRTVVTNHGTKVTIAEMVPADRDDVFQSFSDVVRKGDGWPEGGEYSAAEFHHTWIDLPTEVNVARVGAEFAGAYLVKPNFVGRAAHIANCGYFVDSAWRGHGLGRALVTDSIERARAGGYDAIMFNLVFESNPARALYEELGWSQIGRIPDAVEGEACYLYYRAL